MMKLEIYAADLRDLNKILLDHQLEAIAGLRYKVDRNNDLVYLEFDKPTLNVREIPAIFLRLGLNRRFIGAIPSELRSKSKTEPLGV